MASSNKKQIRDIYRRINGLAKALKRGARGGNLISLEHQEAIETLAQYVIEAQYMLFSLTDTAEILRF